MYVFCRLERRQQQLVATGFFESGPGDLKGLVKLNQEAAEC